MDFIFTRRSVRAFKDKEVEDEKVDKILRAAMQAPSAANQRPWEFVVIKGKEKLEKLSKYNIYADTLKNANIAIVVVGNPNRMIMSEYWQQDLGACTQNILLEVAYLGLGATWYSCAPCEEKMNFLKEFCNLEEDVLPYSVVGIGYPAKVGANHFVDRFEQERIKYIK